MLHQYKRRALMILLSGMGIIVFAILGIRLAQGANGQAALQNAPQISIGTGFSYQGYLADGGVPVNGSCSFEFGLWRDDVAGTQVGVTQALNAVQVTEGNFAVVLNEADQFGSLAFHGQARWLEIAVDCDGSGFTTLAPRQPIHPTPYAFSLKPGATVRDDLDKSILTLSNASSDINGVGLTVFSVMDGIHVNASRAGIVIDEADFIGVHVKETGDDGVQIDSAGIHGVRIAATGADGVNVVNAGGDGFEVGTTGQDGFHVQSAGDDGFNVNQAVQDGLLVGTVGQNGVRINNAGGDGVEVGSATEHGYRVAETGFTGVSVGLAGTHGFFVQSAENGSGLYVASANFDGVYVQSANDKGGTFNGENAGILARSGADNNPDIILGGNGSGNDDDNGRIVSPPQYPNSDLYLSSNDAVVIQLNVDGGGESDSDFFVQNSAGETIFNVDNGGTTTVEVLQITGGADLAELFEIGDAAGQSPEPGTVVCLDPIHPGQLIVCDEAHDKKVVGVVSGAGEVAPGMIMGHDGTIADGHYPVALTGRVYVWVDATDQPIQVGDMLTPSNTAGYAMKVTDHGQAQGSIIGKAMTELPSGQGLVLVLVTLQ